MTAIVIPFKRPKVKTETCSFCKGTTNIMLVNSEKGENKRCICKACLIEAKIRMNEEN